MSVDFNSPFANVTVRKSKRSESRSISELITGFRFTDSGGVSTSKVEITLDAEDGWVWGDDLLMRKGSLLNVQFGYPGMVRKLGDFALKIPKGGRETLTLTAHPTKRNRMVRRREPRTFTKMRKSDVARTIFRENGISKWYIDQTKDVLDTIVQGNEGDWEFLQRLAYSENFELYTDDAGAHFEKPNRGQAASKVLRYVREGKKRSYDVVGIGIIEDWSMDDFSAHTPGRIVMRGYDPIAGQFYKVVADEDSAQPEKFAETLGIATPDEGDRDSEGQVGMEIELTSGARTQEEAQREADALYKKYRYAALKLELTTTGDPYLMSRKVIVVEGLGAALDGRWWVKEVVHDISNGYGCTVKLNKDGLNKKGAKKGLKNVTDGEAFRKTVEHYEEGRG